VFLRRQFLLLKTKEKQKLKGTKDRRQKGKKRIKVAVIQIIFILQHAKSRGWPKKTAIETPLFYKVPTFVLFLHASTTVKENTTIPSKGINYTSSMHNYKWIYSFTEEKQRYSKTIHLLSRSACI
jgi:hypothetical protein